MADVLSVEQLEKQIERQRKLLAEIRGNDAQSAADQRDRIEKYIRMLEIRLKRELARSANDAELDRKRMDQFAEFMRTGERNGI